MVKMLRYGLVGTNYWQSDPNYAYSLDFVELFYPWDNLTSHPAALKAFNSGLKVLLYFDLPFCQGKLNGGVCTYDGQMATDFLNNGWMLQASPSMPLRIAGSLSGLGN